MSLVLKANLKVTDLPEAKVYKGAKGDYIPVTIIVNDKLNQFGRQGPVFVEQTKEEREAEVPKHYLGDVKVVHNDLTDIKLTKDLEDG